MAKTGGFSLIELMIALALSSVVMLAAIASLVVAQRGFNAVDTSAQMRENSRFAIEIIQRVALQTGYRDPMSSKAVAAPSAIFGMDNVITKLGANHTGVVTPADFVQRSNPTPSVTDSKCTSSADTACNNGSDALVVRFQGSTDGAMVNCAGVQLVTDEPVVNIFHIAKSTVNGEPALMCTYFSSSSNSWSTQSLVDGVENFQVLYAVDSNGDSVPEQFKNATQIARSGGHWDEVKLLRIGLLMRGPLNSAPVKAGTLATQCILGFSNFKALTIPSNDNINTAPDPSDCVDPPSALTVSGGSSGAEFPRGGARFADDGRMRRVIIFTINLRNAL
jgi:type IV pilus assembly protein PilW